MIDWVCFLYFHDQKLPIHILNYGNTCTSIHLKADNIIGMIQNVDTADFENIIKSLELHFEICNLYVDEFPECFPAVASEHFNVICETLLKHMQDLLRRFSVNISLYQAVALPNLANNNDNDNSDDNDNNFNNDNINNNNYNNNNVTFI